MQHPTQLLLTGAETPAHPIHPLIDPRTEILEKETLPALMAPHQLILGGDKGRLTAIGKAIWPTLHQIGLHQPQLQGSTIWQHQPQEVVLPELPSALRIRMNEKAALRL